MSVFQSRRNGALNFAWKGLKLRSMTTGKLFDRIYGVRFELFINKDSSGSNVTIKGTTMMIVTTFNKIFVICVCRLPMHLWHLIRHPLMINANSKVFVLLKANCCCHLTQERNLKMICFLSTHHQTKVDQFVVMLPREPVL